MKRTPTNFGPCEREYQARVSRSRRLLQVAFRMVLTAAAVVLAGVFLFPLSAHAGRSCGDAQPGSTIIPEPESPTREGIR